MYLNFWYISALVVIVIKLCMYCYSAGFRKATNTTTSNWYKFHLDTKELYLKNLSDIVSDSSITIIKHNSSTTNAILSKSENVFNQYYRQLTNEIAECNLYLNEMESITNLFSLHYDDKDAEWYELCCKYNEKHNELSTRLFNLSVIDENADDKRVFSHTALNQVYQNSLATDKHFATILTWLIDETKSFANEVDKIKININPSNYKSFASNNIARLKKTVWLDTL
ncbi:hypothetical protein SC206_18990 [Rouxiella sp. T17]|uniref:hypothetical protein n=1 Tax=Rouxiella sp. T17 TaxID=3085684 RepID=UPI002FC6DA3F